MTTNVALTDAGYTEIGRRYGSSDVAREATDVLAKWTRDVAALAEYGFGASALEAFRSAVAAHEALRTSRPAAVAEKIVSVEARNVAVTNAWVWVDKTTSLLGTLARRDRELATKLAEASPAEDTELPSGISALKALLEAKTSALPADANVAARIAEADALATAVKTTSGAAATAKTAPVQDTADLDLADGKLYVTIKDLNAAGRKAIRNGLLRQPRSAYAFTYLRRTAERSAPKAGEPAKS